MIALRAYDLRKTTASRGKRHLCISIAATRCRDTYAVSAAAARKMKINMAKQNKVANLGRSVIVMRGT